MGCEYINLKLDEVAPLITDPPLTNFNTLFAKKNQKIKNVTFIR